MMGGDPFMRNGFSHHFNNDSRCKNLVQSYSVSLEDVYNGINKNITLKIKKYCKKCINKCDNCNGKGIINQIRSMGFITQMISGACDKCRGKGYVIKKNGNCNECKGNGNIEEEQLAFLNLPKGFEDNYKTIFELTKKRKEIINKLF
jgi:molecular chaperone DnaJ